MNSSKESSPKAKMARLRRPAVADYPTVEMVDEIMALESQLTIFQLITLAQAHERSNDGVWLLEPTWFWIGREEKLYQAPGILREQDLREMMQVRQLESLGLLRLVEDQEDWFWKLTARGELAVSWYLQGLADHQPG